jgi:glycosyltransferase involved in cell wall biosynthesis
VLVMVGEGELRGEMTEYIKTNKLENVVLTGFVNQSKISYYYMAADVFVMCSGTGETWGLSVNEAMNFAKPVIVSSTCGCSSDLVMHGKNGFVVEEGNVQQLRNALAHTLQSESFRRKAGAYSKQMIINFSNGQIVTNLFRSARQTEKRSRPVRLLQRILYRYKLLG